MKLVDRKSGNVLARALTIRVPRRVTGYTTLLEADAVEYKETVHVLVGAAMREALSFLCLMPCN